MRKTLCFLLLFSIMLSVTASMAQVKIEAPTFDIFSVSQTSKGRYFSKNINVAHQIIKSEPRRILVPISLNGKTLSVLFKRQNILNNDYEVLASNGKATSSTGPLFYSGKITGQSELTILLSISKNDISLNIFKNGIRQSLVRTKSSAKSNQYVLSERTLSLERKSFICESNTFENGIFKNAINKSNVKSDDGKVSIYLEADYQLYLQKGTVRAVENYILSVFAQVALIYANENIDIEISSIKVWDSPDPYDISSPQNALSSFRNSLNGNFDGDLAHLLSGNSADHGGKAYIDALCDKSRAYAYSNILGGYNDISDYSWDAFIISHEMGHNFGSRHTHECIWGPNGDQAIDNCGRTNESCSTTESIPVTGTIMSYCHLDPAGISFTSGFGAEPGNLIRSRYNACKTNTGINCESAIEITQNGKITALGPVKGFGASQNNADHSNWYKFTAPYDGKIKIFNCSSGIDSRLWIHSGDCNSMIPVADSDDNCGNGTGYNYSSSIPQLLIEKDETIFIEWDDRWSDDGFDFYFKFGEDNS